MGLFGWGNGTPVNVQPNVPERRTSPLINMLENAVPGDEPSYDELCKLLYTRHPLGEKIVLKRHCKWYSVRSARFLACPTK